MNYCYSPDGLFNCIFFCLFICIMYFQQSRQECFECNLLQVQVLSTMKVLKWKYIPFWGNVLKYIPSTLKMYLSTIRSTFQLPSNFLYPVNQTKFLT